MTWEYVQAPAGAIQLTTPGYRLTIDAETCAESPRHWGNVWSFETWAREWVSPDRSEFSTMERFLDWWHGDCSTCGDAWSNHDYDGTDAFTSTGDAPADDADAVLTFVEHDYYTGALSECDRDRADGVAYVTGDTVRLEQLDAEQVHANLRGELDAFNTYARGEVLQFWWETWSDCGHCGRGEWNYTDGCAGFYSFSDAIEGAMDMTPAGVSLNGLTDAVPAYLMAVTR